MPSFRGDTGGPIPDTVEYKPVEIRDSAASLASKNHQDRNEDRILGQPEPFPPFLNEQPSERDIAALNTAMEKERRCAGLIRNLKVYGVFDGVSGGGTGTGALASRMASAEISMRLAQLDATERADATLTADRRVEATRQAFEEAISNANRAVLHHKLADRKPESMNPEEIKLKKRLEQMATTVDLARVVGNKLIYAHLGDGAIYLLRNGELKKLTRDHNVPRAIQENYRLNNDEYDEIDRAHGKKSSWGKSMNDAFDLLNAAKAKAVIYNTDVDQLVADSIGNSDPKPDFGMFELQPGDRILITTDGVPDNQEDDEMKKLLEDGKSAAELVEDTADGIKRKKRWDMKGWDDLSAVIIDVPRAEPEDSGFEALDAEDLTVITENEAKKLEERTATSLDKTRMAIEAGDLDNIPELDSDLLEEESN